MLKTGPQVSLAIPCPTNKKKFKKLDDSNFNVCDNYTVSLANLIAAISKINTYSYNKNRNE